MPGPDKSFHVPPGCETLPETGCRLTDHAPRLRVAYVTMAFPVPSETFATSDVRTLHEAGVDIRVHALRPPVNGAAQLSLERRVEEVPVTHGTVERALSGLSMALRRPKVTRVLLTALLEYCASRPSHLLKSLLLAPRALDIFHQIEADQPNVVHIYWGHLPSMVGYLVQRLLPNVPVTISLAAYDLELKYGLTPLVAQDAPFVRTLGRVNVPDVAKMAGIPEEAVTVIHDGVDLQMLDRVVAESAAGADARKSGRIVTAGRLISSKGIDDALEAFARVHRDQSGIRLHILGDGPERSSLESRAKKLGIDQSVEFLGHVSHEQVIREMAKAQVFLFMSTKSSERLPNVVKEAMACGCVCIATDTPGIDELVGDGRSGFVVGRGDVATAASRLRQVLDMPEPKMDSMASAARAHIRGRFRLERCVESYVQRWRDIALAPEARKD